MSEMVNAKYDHEAYLLHYSSEAHENRALECYRYQMLKLRCFNSLLLRTLSVQREAIRQNVIPSEVTSPTRAPRESLKQPPQVADPR